VGVGVGVGVGEAKGVQGLNLGTLLRELPFKKLDAFRVLVFGVGGGGGGGGVVERVAEGSGFVLETGDVELGEVQLRV